MKTYKLEYLEEKLKSTKLGEQIAVVFEEHIEEVMLLINHNRHVTVVWHRNNGPEFIGHAVKSGIEDDFQIPAEIKGVKFSTLIRRMASALQEQGTPALMHAIGVYAPLILTWSERYTSLRQVFEEIKKLDAVKKP